MSKEIKRVKGEQTRKTILEVAKGLFLTQGYTATSMRMIGQAANITPAAIYNHFAGKEEIFTVLLREVAPYDEMFAFFSRLDADTPDEFLAQLFSGFLHMLSTHEDYIQLALIDAQERGGVTLITFLPQLFSRFLQVLHRLVVVDEKHGRLRDIPTILLARTMISLIAGFIMTERIGKPAETMSLPDTDWKQGMLDIFLYGVMKPDRET